MLLAILWGMSYGYAECNGREYEGGDRRGEFDNRGQTRSYEHKHRYPWNLQNYVFWEMTKKVNNVKVRQTASPHPPTWISNKFNLLNVSCLSLGEKGVSTSTLRHTNITQLDISILGLTCLMKGAATIVSPHILVDRWSMIWFDLSTSKFSFWPFEPKVKRRHCFAGWGEGGVRAASAGAWGEDCQEGWCSPYDHL